MKKFMFAAVVAFWSSIFTLWSLAQMAPEAVASDPPKLRSITLKEIAEHNSITDCWMAIDGKVYDFTTYIPKHPTPAVVIDQWCGKEATQAYDTKGYGNSHSEAADAMLPSYLVGELATP